MIKIRLFYFFKKYLFFITQNNTFSIHFCEKNNIFVKKITFLCKKLSFYAFFIIYLILL